MRKWGGRGINVCMKLSGNDANPKREEENMVETDRVYQQQCVEGSLLVQLPIPGE